MSLLIFAFALWTHWIHATQKRSHSDVALFLVGLFVGAALFVRLNEVLWVAPVFAMGAWMVARKRAWHVVPMLFGLVAPLVLMSTLNFSLYGSPFASGYHAPVDAIPGIVVTPSVVTPTYMTILNAVLPFGFHEMNIVRNVWHFHAAFFWGWTALFLVGAIVFLREWIAGRARPAHKALCATGVVVSAYLLILYGSWQFHDNPDPSVISIGTSYIRYWLPVTVFMTGVAAYGFSRILERYSRTARATVVGCLAVLFLALSMSATVFGQYEGLIAMRNSLARDAKERTWLLEHTSANDLVVVDRADKYLFPERSVIVPLRDALTYAMLQTAYDAARRKDARLWYFGLTLPEVDVAFLQTTRLDPLGLMIGDAATLRDKTLYLLTRKAL
ncbi:hypothetical protein HYV72_01625 [Candidatus Uhrbacteria bacterium]|nr:hypothetical protein [Candidatus Uhrbacteria bacterium]